MQYYILKKKFIEWKFQITYLYKFSEIMRIITPFIFRWSNSYVRLKKETRKKFNTSESNASQSIQKIGAFTLCYLRFSMIF